MKKFGIFLGIAAVVVLVCLTVIIGGCAKKSTAPENQTLNLQTGNLVETPGSLTAQPDVNDFVARAVRIFQEKDPPATEIKWLDSLEKHQLDQVFKWMKENIPVDSVRVKALMDFSTGDPVELSNCWGNWRHEVIERQSGGGTGCYSDGFSNDWDCRCGCEWWDPMPDKVYFFPCTNYNNTGSIRIWSSDWRSRNALGSAVSARVYQGCVQICVGYWSLYSSGANPYTLMNSTYIYWQ